MNSFDKVHRGIMKAIYESRLSPGQRLVAPALAQEFQASRNTVREVLGQLAAAGVITMVRNQSPCVRILSRNEMNELLDVVSALLSLAAESAARNLGMPEARQELSEAYEKVRQSELETNLTRFVYAREHFYRTILRLSGNRELIRLFPSMHVHLMRLQLRSIPLVAQSAQFSDYAALNDAILRGQEAEAVAAAECHVQHMKDGIANLPDTMFASEKRAAGTP